MPGSIWPKASSDRVARALDAHSALALAIGGVLYILAVTGTLSVFNLELQRWEQPGAPEMAAIAPSAAEAAARLVFESEDTPTTHLYINFPQPGLPRTVITTDTQAFYATADGRIAGEESFPWTQFLLDLHYYLHLPHTLGIIVVGAFGALLLGLSLSGFLAHPRIFRDAFTFRRGAGRLTLADVHNRLSVWTAPFHIANALTGAILGLATILAFTIAGARFDGDTAAVFSPIFGGEAPIQEGPSPLAEIAGPLDFMATAYPSVRTAFYILHDPGLQGQRSQIIAKHPDRLIFGEYYNFDADGGFLGTTGISDGTVGQQIAGSVYNVHFGNWGGLPVKVAYVIFGVALSAIIATGLHIYFARRREKGRAAPRLEAAWAGLVWGTPAVLAATMVAAVAGLSVEGALIAVFWVGLGLLIAGAAFSADSAKVSSCLISVTAGALAVAISLHAIMNRSDIISQATLSVSIPFGVLAGSVITWEVIKRRRGRIPRSIPAE